MVDPMKPVKIILASFLAVSSPAFANTQGAVQGFGTDIPLTHAVDQIVPEKYSVSFGQGVDVNTPVSWKGGTDWQTVLGSTLSEHGLYMEVSDTDKLRITKDAKARSTVFSGLKILNFRKNKSDVRPDSYPDDLQGNPGLVFAGTPSATDATPGFDMKEGTPEVKQHPTEVGDDAILIGQDFDELAKPSKVWPVFAGDTLENTLATWAEEEEWSVIWNSTFTYPIQASAEFEGDFIAAAGKLIEAMSNAKPSVQGEFFTGNKVLVIKNAESGQ